MAYRQQFVMVFICWVLAKLSIFFAPILLFFGGVLLTLVMLVITVVFGGSEEATLEETQRRARNIETVGFVFQGLAKAGELYG